MDNDSTETAGVHELIQHIGVRDSDNNYQSNTGINQILQYDDPTENDGDDDNIPTTSKFLLKP